MDELRVKAERVRQLRAQFDATLAQIRPRLTPARIVDDTVNEMLGHCYVPDMPML